MTNISTNDPDIGGAPDDADGPLRFPCTAGQERCWFLNRLNPGNTALNVSIKWEIRGRIRPQTIENAFRHVIGRHEILRTRFDEDAQGQPFQELVDNPPEFKLSVIDLRNLDADQREARVLEIAAAQSGTPFDLGAPPLVRATLVQTRDDQAFLLIVLHQTVFDGWSIKVLGRELGVTMAALDAGEEPKLPELALQYGDFALWQAEYLKSGSFEDEIDYWKERLDGVSYFEVPSDYPRTARKNVPVGLHTVVLSEALSDRVEQTARNLGVSTFNLGAAAQFALLHLFTQSDEVVLGTQVAGRDEVDLEDLLGIFINNVVLRLNLSDDPTFEALVSRVNDMTRDALIHQRVPFNKLVEVLNPPRDPRRTPLFSINCIIQRAFMEDARYPDFEIIGVPSKPGAALYDLNFHMIYRVTQWRMTLEYNSGLFSPQTGEQIFDLWRKLFERALENPSARISTLLSPDELARADVAPPDDIARAEEAIRSFDGVADAAVVSDASEEGGTYAFVTASPSYAEPIELLPQQVMEHLSRTLPPAFTPRGVSVLSALPRTDAGALKREALPAPPPRAAAPAAPVAALAAPAAPVARVAAPEVERRMIEIWREVLSAPELGPDDDFFRLGGHSLLAVRLLARVREAFGQDVDLAALFRTPTPRAFAASIAPAAAAATAAGGAPGAAPVEDESASRHWRIVEIQTKGDAAPIFALNHTFLYYHLSRELGDDQPVYGVRIHEPEGLSSHADQSLEAMVADCVKAIRSARPHGPYSLMGLCVNGSIAFEAAQQLRAAGEEVSLLSMIDTWRPGYMRSRPKPTRALFWLELRAARLAHFVSQVASGKMPLKDAMGKYKLGRMILRAGDPTPPSPEEIANGVVTDYFVSLTRRYHAKPYDGRTLLFRSDGSHPRAQRLNFGWDGVLTGEVDMAFAPGWHEDALGGGLGTEAMAEALRRAL